MGNKVFNLSIINPSIFYSIRLLKTKTQATETTLWNLLYTRCRVLVVKNLPANAGDKRDAGLIPGWGRSPGGGHSNPLRSSCLENPMDRGAWRAMVHRLQSQTWVKQLSTCTRAPGIVLGAGVSDWGHWEPFWGKKIGKAEWRGNLEMFLRVGDLQGGKREQKITVQSYQSVQMYGFMKVLWCLGFSMAWWQGSRKPVHLERYTAGGLFWVALLPGEGVCTLSYRHQQYMVMVLGRKGFSSTLLC